MFTSKVDSLLQSTVVLEKSIKAQLSNSNVTKTIRNFKKFSAESFEESLLVYNLFCLKRLESKIRKIPKATYGQFWLKLAVFPLLVHFKNGFLAKIIYKKTPEYPEGPDLQVESKPNLK